jgi:hypothetical protein
MMPMPELTRRRSAEHRHECWQIYYGDIHAGTIASPRPDPPNRGGLISRSFIIRAMGETQP